MKSFLECLGAHHGEHCLHRRQMNINKRSQRRPLTMKPIPVITMATFVLVFGTVAPAYALHDQQDEKQSKSERQQA